MVHALRTYLQCTLLWAEWWNDVKSIGQVAARSENWDADFEFFHNKNGNNGNGNNNNNGNGNNMMMMNGVGMWSPNNQGMGMGMGMGMNGGMGGIGMGMMHGGMGMIGANGGNMGAMGAINMGNMAPMYFNNMQAQGKVSELQHTGSDQQTKPISPRARTLTLPALRCAAAAPVADAALPIQAASTTWRTLHG